MTEVENAITIFDAGLLDAERLHINGPTGDGIDVFSGSKSELTNSSVENLNQGSALKLYDGSVASIYHSTFRNGQASGLEVFGNSSSGLSSLTLRGSVVSGFGQAGVALYDYNSKASDDNAANTTTRTDSIVLAKDSITQNAVGVDYYGGNLSMKYNAVYANSQAGLVDETSLDFSLDSNGNQDSTANNQNSAVNDQNTTSTQAIDLTQNWWGDSSGPYDVDQNSSGTGNPVIETLASTTSTSIFTSISPWLADATQTTPYSNVAFLPGVEGSRLYVQEPLFGISQLGFQTENQLWEPNRNADVEKLYLNADGESTDPSIYTRDIIDRVNIVPIDTGGLLNPDIYGGFMQFMNGLVASSTISAWKPLPYDWRLSLSDLATKGVVAAGGASDTSDTLAEASSGNISYTNIPANGQDGYLIAQLRQLAKTSDTGDVFIVAHSNGGLVAKKLIASLLQNPDLDYDDLIDRIDQLILVAVPQLGTPDAVPAVLHGDGLALGLGVLLDQTVARKLVLNMPTSYNLLPALSYFTQESTAPGSTPVLSFDDSVAHIPALAKDVSGFVSANFQSFENFLLGTTDSRSQPKDSDTRSPVVLNANLLSAATVEHSALDVMTFPSTLSISQIIGWGLQTIDGLVYSAIPSCTNLLLQKLHLCSVSYLLDHSPTFTSLGDGTVVAESAAALDVPSYYVDIHSFNIFTASQSIVSDVKSLLGLNRGHKDILEIPSVQKLIYELLTHSGIVSSSVASSTSFELPDFIYEVLPPSENLGDQEEIEADDGFQLDALDTVGRHTGKIAPRTHVSTSTPTSTSTDATSDDSVSHSESNIPNSSYREIGDKTYIGLDSAKKAPDTSKTSSATTVTITGTKTGKSSMTIIKTSKGKKKSTETFSSIPVTPILTGILEENQHEDQSQQSDSAATSTSTDQSSASQTDQLDQTDQLVLDVNGDSVPDFSINPTSAFDPILYLETMKRLVASFCIDPVDRQAMIARLADAISTLKAGTIPDGSDIVEENIVEDATSSAATSIATTTPASSSEIISTLAPVQVSSQAISSDEVTYIMNGLSDLLSALGIQK
jgi:pimeloyl-ACP methyl ester carboxylesterase